MKIADALPNRTRLLLDTAPIIYHNHLAASIYGAAAPRTGITRWSGLCQNVGKS